MEGLLFTALPCLVFANDSITGCTKCYLNMTVDDNRKGSSKISRLEANVIYAKTIKKTAIIDLIILSSQWTI